MTFYLLTKNNMKILGYLAASIVLTFVMAITVTTLWNALSASKADFDSVLVVCGILVLILNLND